MNQETQSVHVKSTEGEMTLLEHHVPLFASLVPCVMVLTNEESSKDYALAGGFLKFSEGNMLILTDAIEGQEEIDIERARTAYRRAKNRIEKHDEFTNMKRANLALQRAINRIQVYENK